VAGGGDLKPLLVLALYAFFFHAAANDLYAVHIHRGMDLNLVEMIGLVGVVVGAPVLVWRVG